MKKIYLHTNTEYSFLNSTIRVSELINLAVENKLEYLPLTDIDNMYALQYYWEMQSKYNIKPLIGVQTTLQEGFDVILLAKNHDGFVFLTNLIYEKGKGIIPSYYQLENDNVFIIDHELNGLKAKNITVEKYLSNFYLNSRTPLEHQSVFAPAKKVLYTDQNELLPIVNKIGGNEIDNHFYTDYIDEDEFNGLDELVYQNMLFIADSCNVEMPSKDIKLAKFQGDAKKEIGKLMNNEKARDLVYTFGEDVVAKRVRYEFDVIAKLGFLDYFLIIQDIINYAKANDIAIGPGRGSASGSLISYLLGITDINPLEFELLFERFLNVDRVSLPDIDIDIQDNKRDQLLQYIKDKYGENKVALITVFQTLALKNSLRDIGRYLEIPIPDIDKVCNSLTNNDQSLVEAYKNNERYKMLVDIHPKLHLYASQIEGLPRQVGIHAAGVIICDRDIKEVVPVTYNTNTLPQVQFTLNYLERFGLIKIDFLGLKNLTILQEIEALIPQDQHFDNIVGRSYSKFIDVDVAKLLNNLLTNGIFQLESPGMQNAIKEVGIDSFDDIYAIISLFRPGPMQYIPTYGRNKQNPISIEKLHPAYDEIVKNTYGIILYQEQIMQIAQKVAGMSFAQADLLRRAISKKDESKLHSYKSDFFKGGIANGISEDLLEKIYSNIEKFAAYGFNKSHAVAYALIAYKLAYYKVKYPLFFYKVLISNSCSDQQNIKKYVSDATSQGINVYSPEINYSTQQVEIINNELYLPFLMIKGVGSVAADKIVCDREQNGTYKNFIEAYLRLKNVAKVSETVIENLINSNTFREFGGINTIQNAKEKYAVSFNKLFEASYKKFNDKASYIKPFIDEQGINEIVPEIIPTNIAEEMKLEASLLGAVYNATKGLKSQTGFKELQDVTQSPTWVRCFMSKVQKDAKGRPRVTLIDNSKTVIAFGFSARASEILNHSQLREIVALIKLSKANYYTFIDWKEVDEDE
ncbi:DNA polymerase III subunit alpha [Mycoplasmopsis verecunda]|uniref:DNA-directed DNA polymerase n=1 Tax=Mycoplasmopsis verecunda TaxID=171291 RepID=A0A1T4KDL6_9BACT|nr:DNA polymerase III subunit alpha [Mycoplasmopsis verecunda]WPB54863.1 DNA polymerase III subunit alpha [Mycoplasmopsis verecunda]SJZ40445.1 DNA polymerase-3 subunit alpha [Mycoplasmopsis verecunda]